MQRSILSGVLSVASTKVLTLVIGILTTPILYRLLGPTGIGIYTTVLSVFSLFMILVSSGVSDGVRKFIAENRAIPDWESHVVGFYFRLALALAVAGSVLLALAAWSGLVAKTLGEQFEVYFYILAVLVVTDQFREYARKTLMGFGLERYSEPLKVVQKVAFVSIAIPLVYFDFGVAGALAGKIAAGAAVAIVGLVLVSRQGSLGHIFESTPSRFPRRQMLTFNSLSIVLILFLMSLYKIDILMLQLSLEDASKQVGYYRGALELAEFLWFVPLALQTVFVHSTSELWSNDQTEKISKLTARTTRYTFLLTGVMALGLAALADIAVPVYLGVEFMPAVTPLILLLPGALGFAVARPILAISQGKGDLTSPIIATGTAAGINFGLNALLIPRYGMHGAAVATSVGYGSMFLLHLWSARRVGFDPLSDARLGRIAATTALAAVPIFALSRLVDLHVVIADVSIPISLMVVPPLGLGIYLFFAFVTGALGVCEVLRTLADFPAPIGSHAETLQRYVNNMSIDPGPDSIQKLLVVAGILLFVAGIGFAFLDPGIGLGGFDGDSGPEQPTTNPGPTTGQPTSSPGGETSTTPAKETTSPTETTQPPDRSTSPDTSTPPDTTSPPTTTTTTSPPSTTTTTTSPPPTTTTTTPPPTTTTTTTSPAPTTTTTSPAPTTTTTSPAPTTTTTSPPSTTVTTSTTGSTTSETTNSLNGTMARQTAGTTTNTFTDTTIPPPTTTTTQTGSSSLSSGSIATSTTTEVTSTAPPTTTTTTTTATSAMTTNTSTEAATTNTTTDRGLFAFDERISPREHTDANVRSRLV
ncbi:polysaccharide biosynthesis protein [halophilic archaeon]|nr:polysaccharide biosynthesis protein [halophilic archaeon]